MSTTYATVTWKGDLEFEALGASGHTLTLDAAPSVGGHDAGFRPMELLAVGLAGCTAMDVISILQKKRQEVTRFEVKVSGKRAPEHPKRYTELHIEYLVKGHAIRPEAVERAIELSQTKYCSAYATLQPALPITTSYRIEESESVAAPVS